MSPLPMNGRSASSLSERSTVSSSSLPNALPSDEALEILLSPDGYYSYLGIPKPEPSTLVSRTSADATSADSASPIDLDQVKKNYRRLSLKHHPDRKTGDPETFRILHRAKVVLSSPKLRREYDLVGLDLDDDAEEDHDHDVKNDVDADAPASSDAGEKGEDDQHARENSSTGSGTNSKTETVMGHLASATLAGILQMVVRTGLMALVSVLLSRYSILTFLSMGLLCFLSTRIYLALKQSLTPKTKLPFSSMKDVFSPLMIALGLFCMYRGRRITVSPENTLGIGLENESMGDSTNTTDVPSLTYLSWSWTFWVGETIVMTCFLSNSFEKRSPSLVVIFAVISLLFSLWLRGRFWRYAALLGLQGIIALLVVLVFPVMEMILEEIVQEKMRKVGEKIRAHDARVKNLMRKKGG